MSSGAWQGVVCGSSQALRSEALRRGEELGADPGSAREEPPWGASLSRLEYYTDRPQFHTTRTASGPSVSSSPPHSTDED